jgi:argininosuccinate lyase
MMALWDGRFEGSPAQEMQEFGESMGVDLQMWREDIMGSRAHAQMLCSVGLLSESERDEILDGLSLVEKDLAGGWIPSIEDEDIHMAVEGRLHMHIGAVAGKLHTARSRNDQVATDVRLWLRSRLDILASETHALIQTLADRALKDGRVLVPGYTHLQRAQPIWIAHQLLAHAWSFSRDCERINLAKKHVNQSPLGAAAMAGTPHPIDRMISANILGFDGVMENAMDAVSARDHMQEVVSVIAILSSHLSRLSAELILWSSKEFSRIRLSDDWSTGSSIMPQKRNPDAAELIRGKTGRVYGALTQLLTLTKGLPMAYNRDLQEDRHALFDAVATSIACVRVMKGCISSMEILPGPNLEGDLLLATELADYLSARGLPFREAHHATGRIVRHCEQNKIGLHELSLSDYQSFQPIFAADIFSWISPEAAVERRTSRGGTSWQEVTRQVALLRAL